MSYICLITNRNLVSSDEEYFRVIEEAINAGIDHIILREKELPYKIVLGYAIKIKGMIGSRKTKLFINSMYKIKNEIEGVGIHMPYNMFIELKNDINGEIGVSVHSVEEAINAYKLGASYILCSNIYETNCKKGLKGKGLLFIKEIKSKVPIKVIALGGINILNYKEVLNSGADGIGIMSDIMKNDDVYNLVVKYKSCN
ncbi:thiamine phosphate synthase [uncultured Clostridium sp.]|jgi:thiamine-phosphate pyrophosphorylase|uniref:thiamine phosphate synthase n=1 Tax=uncultured Clostridium sp. TaxID=59620 RepID=UPI00260A38B8|nr:thiamine phosphate synthase [uncultured Clostridium sp.]